MTALFSALALARQGLPVFPLSPGTKIPLKGSPGVKGASKNLDEVGQMFRAADPRSNIGIRMGRCAGGWVLDVDPYPRQGIPGEVALEILQEQHGRLPPTRTARTPSGGFHLWFACPDFEVRPGQGIKIELTPEGVDWRGAGVMVPTGLDWRGEDSYVVAPPSWARTEATASKPAYEGSYQWATRGIPVADAPDWLLDLVRPKRAETYPPMPAHLGDCPAAQRELEDQVRRIRTAGEGMRHRALNEAAFIAGRWIGAGLLDEATARRKLESAALSVASGRGREISRTIDQGIAAGALQPKQRRVG